jgi:hypothetical protein
MLLTELQAVADDVKLGTDVKLGSSSTCWLRVGDETKIGAFVEIRSTRRSAGAARFRRHLRL